jgi:hypothetical protein
VFIDAKGCTVPQLCGFIFSSPNKEKSISQAFQNAHFDLTPIWKYKSKLFNIPHTTAHHQIIAYSKEKNSDGLLHCHLKSNLTDFQLTEYNFLKGTRLLI